MACSFEDVALLHMVHELRPDTEIIFLDTGGHFPETLDFAGDVETEWSLNMTRTTPGPDAEAWPCGTAQCCELRKVEPLGRALAGRAAWITSVKRVDAPTRATMKTLMWDDKFELVKVNPLATWSDDDVAYYLTQSRPARASTLGAGLRVYRVRGDDAEAPGAGGSTLGSLGRPRQGRVRSPRGLDIHQKTSRYDSKFVAMSLRRLTEPVGCFF